MTDQETGVGRRLLIGAAAAAGGLAAIVQTAQAQAAPESVLAKVRREGKLRIGYGQVAPWFSKDARTGNLVGIFYDVAEELCRALDVRSEYQEVSWQDSTVALRREDFDLFASSMTYTVPRAAVIAFPLPQLWQRGLLALTHRDNAARWQRHQDLNSPDVTFSLNVGSSAETIVRSVFPRATVTTTTGQLLTAAEPVRTKRADVWVNGDIDIAIFARRNAWASIIDQANPFGVAPNTWAVRYGDPDWLSFVSSWCAYATASGLTRARYDHHLAAMMN